MQEARIFWISALVAMTAMALPAHAQEADNPPAQQARPPVFDLQPGPTREEPQPNVQGPRAPGLPAPRLIEDEEEPPSPVQAQPQAQPQPQPQTQTTQNDAATASPSAGQPAAPTDRAPPVGSTNAPADTANSDAVPVDPAPPSIADPSIPAPEDIAERNAPATAPATPADSGGVPWWVWLGLVFAIGAAIAVVRLAASKRSEQAPRFAPARSPQSGRDPLPEPLPRPALPPAPRVTPKPLPTPPRTAPPAEPDAEDRPSRIIVDFQPLKARLSTVGLTISYRLDIQNVSDENLTEIGVQLGIRCADGAPGKPQINPEPPCVTLDALKPGERHVQTSVIRLDPDAYRPVQSDGRLMIVPVVDMLPKYRDGDGALHEMHAEMLIGREHLPPQPKMQPFWLERGFGQFEKIGCRMVSVKRA